MSSSFINTTTPLYESVNDQKLKGAPITIQKTNFVVDEDDMTSNTDLKVPSTKSIIAYVETNKGTNVESQTFQNVNQNGIVYTTHSSDPTGKRMIDVYELNTGASGVSNTSLDFDVADESTFIQEDAATGTDFVDGKIQLYGPYKLFEDLFNAAPGSVGNNWTTYGYTWQSNAIDWRQVDWGGHYRINSGLAGSGWCQNVLYRTLEGYGDNTLPLEVSGLVLYTNNSTGGSNHELNVGFDLNTTDYWLSTAGGMFVTFSKAEQKIKFIKDNVVVASISTTIYSNATGWNAFKVLFSRNSIKAKIWLNGNSEPDWILTHILGSDYIVSNPSNIALGVTIGGPNANLVDVDSLLVMGKSFSFPTTPKYVTTSDQNHIDLTQIEKINSCSITNTQPAGTSIKGLVSFDNRQTWSKWNGSWVDSGVTNLSAQDIADVSLASKYKLVINSDNAPNNSTVFSDVSSTGRTITPNGDVKHVTHPTTLGSTSAIYMDGSGDYLTLADSDDWSFTGDFTLDITFKTTKLSDFTLLNHWLGSTSQRSWTLFSTSGGYVGIALDSNGTGADMAIYTTNKCNDGNVHRVTVTRSGSTVRLFRDGILENTGTFSGPVFNASRLLEIGTESGGYNFFDGHIFSIEIINGEALYTSNFTPPTTMTKPVVGVGNTISEIQTGLTNLTKTTETKLDFVFDLSTGESSVTPYIDQITVNYDETGKYQSATHNYKIEIFSETQTKITKNSIGIKNIKVNTVK